MNLPKDAKKIELDNITVDFFEFTKDGDTFVYFDTSVCAAPEPMINAMAGLKYINHTNKKLLMKNHQIPSGLFPRIDKSFDFIIERVEDDNVLITFTYTQDSLAEIDFNNNFCAGA
ncbi:hypothetical protein CRU98_07380 [Arcobacter sp. CECT 8986]|uniref:hypothetical protein n=1 Tax=Arcobacter sp. CECT 8986 TaxID=2044507 RepID=UPI001009F3CF|nr:hypothetical protein [Arcobacter sp. CECT 8986]RXJ99177.1 hypothetical protein CRU98_07380 [Arcobacter sp. CECT 8986]